MSWKEEFPKIWDKMMARRDSEFFRDPVDWKALGLYDYPTIIKKPMDMRTLKKNFDSNVYQSPADLASDTRLIFLNAMTYNDPSSKVFSHAKTQREIFESAWNAIVNAEEDKDRPPSVEQLTEFVEKCHRMTPEDLATVLQQLESLCPNCILKKPDTNEVDVNTDLISGPAFKEISNVLDSIVDSAISSARRSSLGSRSTA